MSSQFVVTWNDEDPHERDTYSYKFLINLYWIFFAGRVLVNYLWKTSIRLMFGWHFFRWLSLTLLPTSFPTSLLCLLKILFLFFSLVTLQKYNTSSISFLLLSFIFLVKSPFIHFVSIDYISLSNYNLFCNTKLFYIWNINYNSITTLTQIKPLKLCINTLHFSIIKVVNVVTRFSSFTNEDIYVEWKKKKIKI